MNPLDRIDLSRALDAAGMPIVNLPDLVTLELDRQEYVTILQALIAPVGNDIMRDKRKGVFVRIIRACQGRVT